MMKIWRPKGRVLFTEIKENLLLIEFEEGRDMNRVKEG